MPKLQKKSRLFFVMLMLLNTVLWGAALPIVKPALETTTPFRYLFYRYLFASIFSLPILFYYLPKIRHKLATIKTVIILEILGTTIALGLLYSGLALTTSIEASLIATTSPIFTTIGGIIYLKEKQEKREWVGLAIAVAGTLLLAVEPILTGKNGQATFSLTGNLLVFAQNLIIAGYYLLAKKYYNKIPKLFVTTISFYVGTVSFFLLSALRIQQTTDNLRGISLGLTTPIFFEFIQSMGNELSQPTVLFPVLYMAIFGSIIGLTAYIKGQDGMEASEASVFTYLQPLVYIPLATIFLKESFTLPMLLAVAVIAGGVFWAEKR